MIESLMTSGRGRDNRNSKPRLVGDIINEMFKSNSPLAQGYRKFLAAKVNAEKGGKNNG